MRAFRYVLQQLYGTSPKALNAAAQQLQAQGSPQQQFQARQQAAQQAAQPEPLNDPNLTDDTFVVEAPSFIVPYVYERPPKETIQDFKKSVSDLVEKKLKEEKEEKAKSEKNDEEDDDSDKKSEKSDKDKKDEAEKGDSGDKEKDSEKKEGDEPKKEGESDPLGAKKEDVDKKAEEKDPLKTEEPKKPKTYFETVLGKFIMDLGMNLVQEAVQVDLLKEQNKRAQRDKSASVMHSIKSLKKNIEVSKEKNKDFAFEIHKCKHTGFQTESQVVMEHHYEAPFLTR